jgi:predicted alpha/beta-fold hydrolase
VALRRERLETPDNDFLDLDFAEVAGVTWSDERAEAPFVLLLHGLEGSAASGYALEMYRALGQRGVRSVGLNFRSCSGEINRARRLYHSGETGDVALVVKHLAARYPAAPFGMVGVSLGGNVLLKFLGERGEDPELPVRAAAAVSVPYDLSTGADALEHGLGPLYAAFFLRKLKRKVRAKAHQLDGACDVPRTLASHTMREFDDAATAPLHGFAGAEDYYLRSSSSRFLGRVRVPTLLLHSMDDPFLPASSVPVHAARENPSLQGRFLPKGGHVGFVEGPPWAPRYWVEQEAAQFLAERLGS